MSCSAADSKIRTTRGAAPNYAPRRAIHKRPPVVTVDEPLTWRRDGRAALE